MNHTELRDQGRRAFDRGEWPEAYEHLRASTHGDGAAIEPDDFERLAVTSYLTGHDEESTNAWIRAHQAWLDRGVHAPAVRCAFWAGFGLIQRGEMAQGGGWLARGGVLVDQHGLDCVECGYLLLPAALQALGSGEVEAARELLVRASELARRFGDADLAALGAIGRGEAMLRTGRLSDAVPFFDEAMVSVTAGETSPVVSGIVYCAVIDACHESFDFRRAREWTAALDRWCGRQPGLVPYRGQCLVHRAQVLQGGGEWAKAMVEARRACERLAEPPHPAIGMAHYELGELHRLRGELPEAEAAYRAAHAAGRRPHPGLALLRLAQGRGDAAAAAIERALDDADDPGSRARLLPAFVEIMLATQRTEDARRAAEELEDLAGASGGVLDALASEARGAVLLADGQARPALEALHVALRSWQEIDAPYAAAEVRVLIATACRALGDTDTADLECDTARAVFERLGAGPALARLDELVARAAGHDPLPVTPRELDVLRLVASGRTNREIADALSISERTVERHLGNVFTKLDVPNRAAATAYAYDHGLVSPHG